MKDRNLRKRAKVQIDGQTLVDIFKKDGKAKVFIVDQGFPPDSLIVGAVFDPERDIWEVAVSSEEFDEIEPYEVLPELPVITTTSIYVPEEPNE